MKNPVTVEDLLKDCVVSVAFPNTQCLLTTYMISPYAEAVVECGFEKMGQIMTKKSCGLDNGSLDILMRISHRQEPLKSHELNQIIDTWKRLRDCRIFSEEVTFS